MKISKALEPDWMTSESGLGQHSGKSPSLGTSSASTFVADAGIFVHASLTLLAATTVLGVVAAYLFTGTQIPQYRATATLEVQDLNENFLNREVSQVTPFSQAPVANDIQTHLRILQSGALIGNTLRSLPTEVVPPPRGLRAWIGGPTASAAPAANDSPDGALERAARNLQVRETRQSRIVDVSYESPDARYAAAFANGLAQRFIEQSIDSRIQISKGTSEFLEKQLAEAGAKMAESEHRLQNYARQAGLLVTAENRRPDEDRFRQVQESLSKAQENRIVKQARMETAASAPLDSLEIPLGSVLRDFQARLAELRRQRAELASVYTSNFDGVKRLDAQIAKLELEQARESNAILQSIKNDYADAVRRERLLEESYRKQFSQVSEQSGNAIQYGILKREVDTNRDLYNNLLQRTAEAKVASALRASGARLVDPARIPRLPFKPNKLLNLLWGGTSGFLLGLAIAVARRSGIPGAVTQPPQTALPELGAIPKMTRVPVPKGARRLGSEAGFVRLPVSPSGIGEDWVAMAAWSDDRITEVQAFRSLLTSIVLSRQQGQKSQVLVVTSSKAREGKTTIVANLAGVLARAGRKVLIVDASNDRRLGRFFEVSGNSESNVEDILQFSSEHDSLLPYVTSETFDGNVAYLGLGRSESVALSPGLSSIVAAMRHNYDVTLIDTPSIEEWHGVRLLSQVADGVILVSTEVDQQFDASMAAAMRLRADGATVLGSVRNRAS
jgi:polysaccharide biosynthesis transport protein